MLRSLGAGGVLDQSMSTGSPHLIVQREGPLAMLIINRPEQHNAVSLELWRALPEILAGIQADETVRVLILRGAGERAFVAGSDVDELDDVSGDAAYAVASAEALDALARLDKPTIALIHGHCVGAGVALALACDLRFASDDARFSLPAVRFGLAVRVETVRQLARVVGPTHASELLFSGRRFDALEARRMNLINHVVAASEVEDAVEQVARQIADNAPMSLRAAKLALRAAQEAPGSVDPSALEDAIAACTQSSDRAEGRRALRNKRKPRFTGR
jgi:enoyl-CoA hydratase